MRSSICSTFIGFLLGLCLAPVAVAGEAAAATYDRVSLSAAAQSEVANDRLRAELYIQREGEDAAALAADVNRAIDWAVALAKGVEGVEVQTQDYRTHPLYRKQILKGWRVRQSIRLESADTTALSELIGRLQQRLAVESVGYELSAMAREQAENALIGRAIAAFTTRAEMVTQQFGRSDYRLVQVDINSGARPPQPMYRTAAMVVEADRVSAPRIKLGSQEVQVWVNGTIELRVK